MKTVSIDGVEYIIQCCHDCPFYDNGDDSWGCHCQFPKNPSKIVSMSEDFSPYMDELADDCPLRDANE